ncbi:dioxygenase [Collibacillus ludicampi]|uniref:Dioxygenase n=1 Tax=Collibacillus ludicampi TaxID=2771369 RepID=A0AAV4LG87_9BACL|nr:class III extradiol ring-cleavage dioxygenase [Collibacillus ludicampi]GIM46678.1 dioxygenase [Collibacillus ludicampi]
MLPSFFLAHGAPTLVLENNEYTKFLRDLANELQRPKGIVLFSAHWEEPIQSISGVETYDMIYDFYGFPDEMYQITYPATGNKQMTKEIQALLTAQGIPSRIDEKRGLDHGAWVILRLMYPDADIPVTTLSVNPALPPQEQYQIGRALASLRDKDILIIGSGGTVHNLRRLEWNGTHPNEWAVAFDRWLANQLEEWDLESLFQYENRAPYAKDAVPRNEHFIPLLIAMGAANDQRKANLLYQNYQYGTLSLSCWQFGE